MESLKVLAQLSDDQSVYTFPYMNRVYEAWGRRVRKERMRQVYSQADVARMANCTKSVLDKIENGRMIPSDKTRIAIAYALRVQVIDLFPYPRFYQRTLMVDELERQSE